jgi:tetratricopeptide (TPR) repeat protein
MTELDTLLTKETLPAYAASQSLSRGARYAAAGRVHSLYRKGDRIVADVAGRQEYRVEIWAEDQEILHDCDCPIGTGDNFCKHCVAVAVVWLEKGDLLVDNPIEQARPTVTMEHVSAYLRSIDRDALVDMLVDQIHKDAGLREELFLRVARSTESGPDIGTYRKAIDHIVPHSYVEYAESYDWSISISRVLDSLNDLIDAGYARDAMGLIEYAVAELDKAVDQIDDSNGYVGEELVRIPHLYLRACKLAQPEPEELARRLFDWSMTLTYLEYFDFLNELPSYADVLGDKGQSALRTLASEQWDLLPVLGPDSRGGAYNASRYRITSLMETIAGATGDIDAIVAVNSRDLSLAFSYLTIAQIYRNAGRDDEALEWAERGRKVFPEDTDERLLEFLIEEYHRRGRFDDEMDVAWQRFTDKPTLDGFQYLERFASRTETWSKWREKAWMFLRERQNNQKSPTGRAYGYSATPEIVKVLLYEKRDEEAWNEAINAPKDMISDQLWLRLAERRAASDPDDALQVYQRLIYSLLTKESKGHYEEPVDLLRKCRDILIPLSRNSEFLQLVRSFYAEFKRKRNFVKLLVKEKWV